MMELDYKLPKDIKTIQEWADYYKLKINKRSNNKITVYEFAYLIGSGQLDYALLSNMDKEYNELSSEQAELNELMLMEIYTAIIQNADEFEKDYLKDHYIETNWVKIKAGRF